MWWLRAGQKPPDTNPAHTKPLYVALTRAVLPGETKQWKEERKGDVDITVNKRDLLTTDKIEKDDVEQLCAFMSNYGFIMDIHD